MKSILVLSAALSLTMTCLITNTANAHLNSTKSVFVTDSKVIKLASVKKNIDEKKRLRLNRLEEAGLYRSERMLERREQKRKRRALEQAHKAHQNLNQTQLSQPLLDETETNVN
jgi:hypothetical protein